ncbi:MAG: fumarylacetoacetate hydrolase family protein [Campylobacteraceae bacterium]
MNSIVFGGERITPSKVICVARNYVEHIHELKNEVPSSMVLFNKPNSSITDKLKMFDGNIHYEGEICFVIKGGEIAGVGIGLDLTKREIQSVLKEKGLPWERAKAFDGAAVLSEFVDIDGYDKINFELFINGVLKQKGEIAQMIYKPLMVLEEIESFMSLEDGDVIMSGTPKGVGSYKLDDVFNLKLYDDKKLLIEKTWKVG